MRAGLSFNEADRALAGKDILPWDRMRSLVEQLGGHSEDLHFCGRCPCRPAAHRRHLSRRRRAVWRRRCGDTSGRGPAPLDEVASLTGVSADRLEAILLGRCVPAWDTIAALATALRTDPSLLRNLWDGVRCTFSASPHHFPAAASFSARPADLGSGQGIECPSERRKLDVIPPSPACRTEVARRADYRAFYENYHELYLLYAQARIPWSTAAADVVSAAFDDIAFVWTTALSSPSAAALAWGLLRQQVVQRTVSFLPCLRPLRATPRDG
ncbi:helix-turn-helix domain-containing protein [Streptomyces nogalater]